MATAEGWNADALQQALRPVWPGMRVELLPEVDSTNTHLLQRTGDSAPCLLVAEHQTHGRGRLGRPWLSAAGASLTFSLGLPLAPVRWEGLSLAVGLALADALDRLLPGQLPQLMLKWPNDLWLVGGTHGGPGRKLGGVLVETTLRGGQRYCVVGVGLNIRPPKQPSASATENGVEAAAAATLNHGYAWLQELQPGIDAAAALGLVALPLARALRRFESEGFAPLQPAFAARDLLAGRAVSTHVSSLGAVALQGQARGVNADGALLVQSRDGLLQPVYSGEVSVRLQTERQTELHRAAPAVAPDPVPSPEGA